MILNHNYDDLNKVLKGMSVFDRVIYLDKLKAKEEEFNRIEKDLAAGSEHKFQSKRVKKWCFTNSDVLGQ